MSATALPPGTVLSFVPRHPCGWTHQAGSKAIKLLSWLLLEVVSSGQERHIYQQDNEKVTLQKPPDVENNKDRKYICEQSSSLWRWLSDYLQINHAAKSSLQKEVNPLVCLLSLTDFVKNTLFQNVGLLNRFSNKKRKLSKKYISTIFLLILFFSLRFSNYKSFIHEVEIKCYTCG